MSFDVLGLTWIEKSVEYEYIIDGVRKGTFQTAWPLAGDDEKLGDTLFRAGLQYYVVEFKRHIKFFPTEYKKFSEDGDDSEAGKQNFGAAKAALAERGAVCHLMVSGDVQETGAGKEFVLRRYRYFDCDDKAAACIEGDIKGLDHCAIQAYLKDYAVFKQGELKGIDPVDENDEEDDGSGRGRGKAVSMLVGIAANREARFWSLRECLKLQLAPAPIKKTGKTTKPT